jgi:hypothetical protein
MMPIRPYPEWLHLLSWAYVALCLATAFGIVLNSARRPQKMWIMNLVWPITALYFGPFAAWLYWRTLPLTRSKAKEPSRDTEERLKGMEPTREQAALSGFHCGAGCTLGDIAGEAGLFAIWGTTAAWIRGSEFATKLVVDFAFAYVLGIFFQYFTIIPMRGLSFAKGIRSAVRADTISILAFEIGMFGWMALARFLLFPEPRRIYPNMAVFWFMMQIAMMIGWISAYPANVWLLRRGWKEKMPMYSSVEQMRQHRLPPQAA